MKALSSDNAEEFSALWQALQPKVKNHPDFELLDRTIGRWFAYRLHLKGAKIKLEDITSIDKATAMWTFESEIERMRQENAQQALLSAQREHEQKLEEAIEQAIEQAHEQNARAAAKRMAQRGMSYAEIADILSVTQNKVVEYVETR